jgi:hypothetical protein
MPFGISFVVTDPSSVSGEGGWLRPSPHTFAASQNFTFSLWSSLMSPIERALRRVPLLRWCVMQRALRLRQKRRDQAWEQTQPVLLAIGNITIGWAGINLILNMFIEGHHKQIGGIMKELPRNFTRKLEYLQKVESDSAWQPERLAQFRAFRLKLQEMNEFRVKLVHGLAFSIGRQQQWKIHVAKEAGSDLIRWDEFYSSDDIRHFSKAVNAMGHELSEFFAPMLVDR